MQLPGLLLQATLCSSSTFCQEISSCLGCLCIAPSPRLRSSRHYPPRVDPVERHLTAALICPLPPSPLSTSCLTCWWPTIPYSEAAPALPRRRVSHPSSLSLLNYSTVTSRAAISRHLGFPLRRHHGVVPTILRFYQRLPDVYLLITAGLSYLRDHSS